MTFLCARQASAETTLSFTLESTFLSIMTNADNDGYGDEGITVVNPGRKVIWNDYQWPYLHNPKVCYGLSIPIVV